ncbi:MAG: hypothetical protein LBM08_00905 [Dysgonamonadaceae bacterium]|jgi:hypothetical protein|nr:hypothetical protein [Dysgonamonadaceae bacterium]
MAKRINDIENTDILPETSGRVKPVDESLNPKTGFGDSSEGTSPAQDNSKKVSEEEIPEEIKKILRQYSNEKELYVDKYGGAFVKKTQPALLKDAILYKNPFYNK